MNFFEIHEFNKVTVSFTFLLFTINVFPSIVAATHPQCASRDFGKGSFVCVSNETYSDKFIIPKFGNNVLVVESSKEEKRFHVKVVERSAAGNNNDEGLLHIQLNTSETFQKVMGFGGSFTDSATMNIASLTPSLARRLIADYFGADGLEYNFGRIPIAGSDFSTRAYAYNECPDDFELKSFKLSEEDVKYKIPAIKTAIKLSSRKLLLFASAWSAPGWMKTNGKLSGLNGTLIGPVGGKYYQTWANYLVRFIKEYEQNELPMWGLTTQNEPSIAFDPFYKFNTLGFTPEMQREFIKQNLGPTLVKAGLGAPRLQLIIGDEMIHELVAYTDAVLSDATAANYVTGIGIHWYTNTAKTYPLLEAVKQKYPKQFILSTEASFITYFDNSSEPVSLGKWERGEKYGLDIIEVLNRGVTGWIDWNLALDLQGGPNWVGNYVDAPIIVNKAKNEYYKNPMFYVMGHFSKFLKPDSVRIASQSTKSVNNSVKFTNFLTPDKQIVVIALNTESRSCHFVVDVNNGTSFSYNLLPKSITTFVWKL